MQNFTGYEKLKFPFDEPTWTLILVTFVVAFVTIFVFNLMTRKIRSIVIGENVSTPSLNVAAHFFGLGQIVIPRRNFARFILMMFILYCLIIRTAWQSKIFEFMQKEMRKPGVKMVDEALEKYDKEYTLAGGIQYRNGTYQGDMTSYK
jgi:predicted neutral ceramidase superfamily lipid hydrolase